MQESMAKLMAFIGYRETRRQEIPKGRAPLAEIENHCGETAVHGASETVVLQDSGKPSMRQLENKETWQYQDDAQVCRSRLHLPEHISVCS